MIQLKLFTTAGCHLCEQAEELLHVLAQHYPLQIHHVEIGDDDRLVARYGMRIPVVQFPDHSELDWPFQQSDLTVRLEKLSHLAGKV